MWPHVCIYIYIYIHTYIVSIYIYIYIFIYTYTICILYAYYCVYFMYAIRSSAVEFWPAAWPCCSQKCLRGTKGILAIFYPFSQFCEIDVSLPSL